MTAYVFMMVFWFISYYYLIYHAKGLPDNRIHARKKWFVFLAGSAMFFIMGFRHKYVGIDTMQYLNRYRMAAQTDWNAFLHWENWVKGELGFTLVGKILQIFGVSDQMYLILYALFISIVISKLIYKYCNNLFWGFYLHATIGMFTMSMSGMRQSIACCICWLATDYILKKTPIRFILLVLLAATFHQSAIFFAFFYFARYLRIERISGWLCWLVCVCMLFFRPVLITLLSSWMPEKYGIYGMINDQYPINPMLVVIALLIPMFCLFFREKRTVSGKDDEAMHSLCFCGSFLYAIITILSLSSNAIGRMSFYYYIFNVILLGNVITDIKDYRTRYIAVLFAILLPGFMFFKSQSLRISPYYFFWQTYGL